MNSVGDGAALGVDGFANGEGSGFAWIVGGCPLAVTMVSDGDEPEVVVVGEVRTAGLELVPCDVELVICDGGAEEDARAVTGGGVLT